MYKYENQSVRYEEANDILPGEMRSSGQDFVSTEFFAHPRHKKLMKRQQVEGFNFLGRNLVNDNPDRSQQLEVLKQWATTRSILFLGYTQFSLIVCNSTTNETSSACEKILVKKTSILIMDEGHTPRNENIDQLVALERVETPRKVFNILNLVRPRFL
ncbi:hypothetical protein POM88_016394 [Heracleum sosnowskyi]|uniref:SNF2 N-terminal domain-containing protein n=1 Tax=Heracleum sosnowskyi TaxID=360622 RepID=A0AAD8MWV9_9APIA|nr:hypothetical protein POM88_016394 [Heracleum sosnowskyi]